MDLFGIDDDSTDEEKQEATAEDDIHVWVPPQMDEAAEQKLLALLQSGGPDSDGWNDEGDVLDCLHHSDESTLSRLLTIDTTKGLLTEWNGDPVNHPGGLTGLQALANFPAEIVQHHAKGILEHADQIIDDQYGFHEDYYRFWENVINGLAAKQCSSALTTFVSETLLPRIRDAAKDHADECGDAESKSKDKPDSEAESKPDSEAESESEDMPDLFQGELLDTAARMVEIALKCASAFKPCIAELSAVLEPHWKAIEDCGVYEERLSALRKILADNSGSDKREATESAESMPDAKKTRSS